MEVINWALLGVIAIILLGGLKGKRAGFIKAAFSAFSLIVSIIGAKIVGPVIEAIFPVNKIFSYILAFIIVSIGLSVACTALNIVAKLPVLHQINSMAGFFVGLVEGLLDVWIIFIVLDLFAGTEWGSALLNSIHNSQFLTILYENNLLTAVWNLL